MINIKPLRNSDKRFFLKTINEKSVRYQDELDINISKEMFPLFINNKESFWNVIQDKVNVGLFNIFYREGKCHFGIIIAKEHRRKGYCSETVKEFLKTTDKQGIDVYLDCFSGNPIIKLYRKLGFKETGEYKIIRKRKFLEMLRIFPKK